VVGLALVTTAVLPDWLPCAGATTGELPVVAPPVGDWLGLGGVVSAGKGGAVVVGGGATGAAVVGTGTGTDET
jgi:hypothetical protein